MISFTNQSYIEHNNKLVKTASMEEVTQLEVPECQVLFREGLLEREAKTLRKN